jgi:regulator of sigma E protease
LVAILIFGLLVFVHEGGHFLAARMFGVQVDEFAIGMGPKILSHKSKKSGTSYSWRLFPIGGFVSMPGEDEQSNIENGIDKKPAWQRFIITAAGAFMNLVLGIVVMFILVISTRSLASNTIYCFTDGATPNQLMVNDTIIAVDGVRTHTGNEVVYEIMHKAIKPIDITVIRNGEKLTLEDVVFETKTDSGVTIGEPNFFVYSDEPTFLNSVKHAWYRSLSTIKMIWDSLIDLLTGRYGVEAVSGPVGVTQAIGQAAKTGVSNLVYLAVVISMNLGVFNLLPFPALDGGRLVFITFEMITRRRLDPKIEGYIHLAGITILILLMIFITAKDIVSLI